MSDEGFKIDYSKMLKTYPKFPVDNLGEIPSCFPRKSIFRHLTEKKGINIKDEKAAEILCKGWSEALKKEGYPKSNLSKEFFMEVVRFSREIGADPLDLSAIMMKESHFDPSVCGGSYYGLIQMDKVTFDDTVKVMIEYNQYCKDNPEKKLTLKEYENMSAKKGFKKPVCRDKINFEKYKKLSREKQMKYAEYFLKYWIEKKNLKGKKISGKQLWALIHSPNKLNNPEELKQRQLKLNNVKKCFPVSSLRELENLNKISIKS